ncbi:hypothetical protein GGI1_09433 [Acidithiobacillus sp. GGI-221]|nr:hypothetical protein GGI1_09433 [Acidithiobacillus sp. GGI-221]
MPDVSSTRSSVQAVLTQLEIRRSMPKETRNLAIMDDSKGKSFLGLVVWNIGTIAQDIPELVAVFMLSIAGLLGFGISRIF